jgi:membrane protease subunit HflC
MLAVVLLAAILGPQFLFTVDQTQHVVITRFGEVRRVISNPGLNVKMPFIDTVNVLDNRILRIDVPPASMPDVDSQFLDIDAYVRYRILDPRAFRETLVNELTASSRIGAITIAQLRQEIGGRIRTDIIGGESTDLPDGTKEVDARLIDGIPTREAITRLVRDRTQTEANRFGVEIVDVRIKRADFPQAVEANVFNRMRTERAVQAERLRAEGEEEFLNRTAGVDRQVTVIQAQANQTSNELRGDGEAEAISILAQALGQDPEFYSFLRSLDAYRLILRDQTTAVLPADSDLFQYLQSPNPPAPGTDGPGGVLQRLFEELQAFDELAEQGPE